MPPTGSGRRLRELVECNGKRCSWPLCRATTTREPQQTADAETSAALASAARHRLRGPHIPSSRAGRFNRMPLPVASSFDNSEHTPIGSSRKRPAQSAPFMTSGGTGVENIIVNKARNRPLAKRRADSCGQGCPQERRQGPCKIPVHEPGDRRYRQGEQKGRHCAYMQRKHRRSDPRWQQQPSTPQARPAKAPAEETSRFVSLKSILPLSLPARSRTAAISDHASDCSHGRRRTADAEAPAARLRQHRVTGYAALETRRP